MCVVALLYSIRARKKGRQKKKTKKKEKIMDDGINRNVMVQLMAGGGVIL